MKWQASWDNILILLNKEDQIFLSSLAFDVHKYARK